VNKTKKNWAISCGRSPFSTQPLRDRPSDRLRCDRPMPDATPAVRSPSSTGPASIAFLHSATARSSLRSTQMRSPYARCNSSSAIAFLNWSSFNRLSPLSHCAIVPQIDSDAIALSLCNSSEVSVSLADE
jgi:hypothetical protein